MMVETIDRRLHEIDGIRGWAALVVLLAHVCFDLFHNIFPYVNFPNFLLFNGRLAVEIFFILSGDALSSAYLRTGSLLCVDKLLVKRYFRLVMPIAFASFSVWAVMVLGWDYHQAAAVIVKRESWLGAVLPFQPDFLQMLYYAFGRVFLDDSVKVAYNPIFWTLAIEFVGSLAVFLYIYMHAALRHPRAILAVIIFFSFLFLPHYANFFIGVLFGMWRQDGLFEWLYRKADWQIALFIAFFIFVYCSLFTPASLWYSPQFNVVQAAFFVFLIYACQYLRRFFSSGLSRILGQLSYALYAIHFAVIVSLSSFLIVVLDKRALLTHSAIAGVIVASIMASFMMAAFLHVLERRYLALLRRLTDVVLGGRQ